MEKPQMLQAALWYANQGLSVIPVGQNKKPLIKWKDHQEKPADADQVESWFKRWPDAMIGLCTGQRWGICVIDVDVKNGLGDSGHKALAPYLPDTLITPTATTPSGGVHYYFRAPDVPLGNNAGGLTGVDFRGDGGYIVAPPSVNGKGAYAWMDGLAMGRTGLAYPPDAYLIKIFSFIKEQSSSLGLEEVHNTPQPPVTNRNISFEQGGRDDALFHLANHLFKGGMDNASIQKYLYFFGNNCSPPFPEREIAIKIQSALKRVETHKRSLTAEIRKWVSETWGNFSATDCYQALQIVTSKDKNKARVILGRLVDEGLTERMPEKNGCYRRVNSECRELDFKNTPSEIFPVFWPFGIENLVSLHPKSIAAIAGASNPENSSLGL